MPTNITDTDSYDDPVASPDDGETADAASVLQFTQALANRNEFNRASLENALLDVSAQTLLGSDSNELRNLLRMFAASAAIGAAEDVTAGAGFPTYQDPLNAVAANATRFLVVGEPDASESNLRALYSLDGISWTAITAANGTEGLNAVASNGSGFLAGGDAGRVVVFDAFAGYSSDTAISGTPVIYSVAGDGSYWVAATSSGIWYSSDGVTWTQNAYNTGVNKLAVVYGNGYFAYVDAISGGRYIADPSSGTGNAMAGTFPASVTHMAYGNGYVIGSDTASGNLYRWDSNNPTAGAITISHGTSFSGSRVFFLESLGVFVIPVASAASGEERNLLLTCDGRRFSSMSSNLAVVGSPPTYAGMAAGPLSSDIAGLPIIVGEASGAPVVYRGNRGGLNIPRASY